MEGILANNIPSKNLNSRHNLPRFKKAKKSGMDEAMARYLDIKQMVKRELRDAERVYVNGILQNGLELGNNKPFWKYVKIPKTKNIWYLCNSSITDSLSKAEIFNSKFKSVFTPHSGNTFPQLPGTQWPKIKPLHMSDNGIFMLIGRINVSVIWTRQASWKITAVYI